MWKMLPIIWYWVGPWKIRFKSCLFTGKWEKLFLRPGEKARSEPYLMTSYPVPSTSPRSIDVTGLKRSTPSSLFWHIKLWILRSKNCNGFCFGIPGLECIFSNFWGSWAFLKGLLCIISFNRFFLLIGKGRKGQRLDFVSCEPPPSNRK